MNNRPIIAPTVPVRESKDLSTQYICLDRQQEDHVSNALKFLFCKKEFISDLTDVFQMNRQYNYEGKDLTVPQFRELKRLCGKKKHRFHFKLELEGLTDEKAPNRETASARRLKYLEHRMTLDGQNYIDWTVWMAEQFEASAASDETPIGSTQDKFTIASLQKKAAEDKLDLKSYRTTIKEMRERITELETEPNAEIAELKSELKKVTTEKTALENENSSLIFSRDKQANRHRTDSPTTDPVSSMRDRLLARQKPKENHVS